MVTAHRTGDKHRTCTGLHQALYMYFMASSLVGFFPPLDSWVCKPVISVPCALSVFPFLFYLIISQSLGSLFFFFLTRHKGGSRWKGWWGETGRRKGTHNQDIHYVKEKRSFSVKEIKRRTCSCRGPSISSTYTVAPNHLTLRSRGANSLFLPGRAPGSMWYPDMLTNKIHLKINPIL